MVKASRVLDRVLVLEMVRVTEAAAVAASRLIGRGDEKAADAAAVEAMRAALNTLPIDGTVVIGEGERDEAMARARLRPGAKRQALAEAGVPPADDDRIVPRPAARTAGDAVDASHRVEDAGIVRREQLLRAERRRIGLREGGGGQREQERRKGEKGNSRLCHGPPLSALNAPVRSEG